MLQVSGAQRAFARGTIRCFTKLVIGFPLLATPLLSADFPRVRQQELDTCPLDARCSGTER